MTKPEREKLRKTWGCTDTCDCALSLLITHCDEQDARIAELEADHAAMRDALVFYHCDIRGTTRAINTLRGLNINAAGIRNAGGDETAVDPWVEKIKAHTTLSSLKKGDA